MSRPAPMLVRVTRTRRVSDSMVRVSLTGDDLERFGDNGFADAYVKLLFEHPDAVGAVRPFSVEAAREQLPPEQWPVVRTYTVRSFSAAERRMDVDFVVHGDSGIAGPWAARAVEGDELHVVGPGGAWSPAADADAVVLVGDESALPAIAAGVERLAADAVGTVVVEVHGAGDEQELGAPSGVEVVWLHRHDEVPGSLLVPHVREMTWPAGDVDVFVHGEAAAVRDLRRLLKVERKVPAERLSISGYWRLGADDEAWRSVKREWNAAIEAEEAAAGVS